MPLKQTFCGVTATKRFEKIQKLDELCYDVALSAVDRGHQVMVFVHARNATVKTGMTLKEMAQNKAG